MHEAKYFSYYSVKNDLAAVILEARLIGINKPKYNSVLKDDRSSLYIKISGDSFPKVDIVRKSELSKNDDYYGPFTSNRQTQRVLRVARKIFKFCSKPGNDSKRPCFYFHIDQCDGACVGKVSKIEYRRKIGYLKRFLNGETKTLIKKIDRQIKNLSKNEKFEQAGKLKQAREAVYEATRVSTGLSALLKSDPQTEKQLRNLKEILSSHGMEVNLERIEGYDVSTLQQKNTVGGMVVFVMGVANKRDYRLFKMQWDKQGDTAAMEEMLERRFNHQEWPFADLVLIDGGKPQVSSALKVVPNNIEVIGIAKKEETLVYKRNGRFVELKLKDEWPAKALIQKIRDEAHRFSNSYQSKIRRKAMIDK